jgi:MFS family permease
MHGTPVQVSMIMVSFLTPLAVLSPIAGVFVDKWNVKWTMVASDLIRGVLVLNLISVHSLPAIYATFAALSIVSTLFIPAQSVAVRVLAPPAALMVVNALMTQAVQGGQIISPSLAGALVQWLGAGACFIYDSFSFFFSAAMVMTLTIERPPAPAAEAKSVLASLSQGFRFIFGHPIISFVLVSMASGMFAVRCFGTLLSIYVRDILHSNAALFGTLNTLIGVGMIVGSQSLHRFGRKVPHQYLVLYGLGGMGVAVFITALFGKVASTAIGMLGIGFFAAFIMVTAQTMIQQETPHEMLGRVSSSMMSLMAMAQVLAMFFAGPVAEYAGLRNLYFGSAVMLVGIGVTGMMWLRGPKAEAHAAD